jgi:hypothetical protein
VGHRKASRFLKRIPRAKRNAQAYPPDRRSLLVLVAETHRLGQGMARHSTSERIPLQAGVPVVDTAERARVGDLRSCSGEAREGAGPWPNGPRIKAAAPLTVEWPEGYSGCGGVPAGKKSSQGVQEGSKTVALLPSVSPPRMAVIGRQKT